MAMHDLSLLVQKIGAPTQSIDLLATYFIILAENLYPTAPRALSPWIEHTVIGRLVISLYRKGQEV